jgi:hypothetical protein
MINAMMPPTIARPPITPPTMALTGVEDDEESVAEGVADIVTILVTRVAIVDVDELDVEDELVMEDVVIGIGIPIPVSVMVGGRETVAEPSAI